MNPGLVYRMENFSNYKDFGISDTVACKATDGASMSLYRSSQFCHKPDLEK